MLLALRGPFPKQRHGKTPLKFFVFEKIPAEPRDFYFCVFETPGYAGEYLFFYPFISFSKAVKNSVAFMGKYKSLTLSV